MKNALLVALALGATAPAAMAEVRSITWNRGEPSASRNDGAGVIRQVVNTYDTVSDQFTFKARFDNAVTDGFWLTVSPGTRPEGHSGELALIYVDATNRAAPKATVYAYNGNNGSTSYRDGTARPGTQTPDFIGSLINGVAGTTLAVNSVAGGGREFVLSFDATFIQQHVPRDATDRAKNDWTGVAFGNSYGLSLHTFDGLDTSYSNGKLSCWQWCSQGWLELNCVPTVPTPGAAAVLGLGAVAAGRRRRK